MNRWRDGGLNQGGSCSISGWIQTSYTLDMIFFPLKSGICYLILTLV